MISRMSYLRESEKGFERIDSEAGIIHGVKVLGPRSRNGRIYDDKAIRKAVSFYEGVVVNLNHKRTKPGVTEDRPIQDRWGVLRNARYFEGSIYADLHYIKSHPMTAQLVEAAERFPDTFGLSHDAAGDEQVIDGERRVVEVYDVRSVDVVADPATNDGLFESHSRKQKMKKKFRAIVESVKVAELKECMTEAMGMYPDMADSEVEVPDDEDDDENGGVGAAFKSAMLRVLDDSSLDTAGKLGKLKAIMLAKDKAMEAMKQATESYAADKKKMDEEKAKMEGEKAKMEESVKKLSGELLEAKAKLDREQCRALLIESNAEVTEVRIKALQALQESDRSELVKTFAKPTGKRPGASPSIFQESTEPGTYPADSKEFMNRLR